MRGLILIFFALLMPALSWATGGDRIPGSRYVSGRGAALGDAYIGLADTVGESLFYNPAGLGKVRDFTIEALNFQAQANSDLASNFGSDFYKFQSLDGYEDHLKTHPGSSPGGGVAILPAFGFAGFGFGLLYQSRLMGESDGTTIHYRSTYQLIPTAGYGLRLASGVLRIGYSLQWVNQASGDKTVDVGTRPMDWNEGLAQGQGFSHNLGMTLTLPFVYQPTFSLVARNMAGLRFSGKPIMSLAKNPSGDLETEKMSVDGSFGAVTKISAGWQLSMQLAYRDATNSSSTRTLSHVATGLEFTASDRFFLRGGFGSGYPSAGLGIRTSRSEVNFAWYSEDLGNGSTPQRDIRYLFQFILRAM